MTDRRQNRYSYHGGDFGDSSHGRSLGSSSWWDGRQRLMVDDEVAGNRRVDSLDSQGNTVSDLNTDSRSSSFNLDIPYYPRRIRSSEDRRRSFYSVEDREARRNYYLDDAERPGPSYIRRSHSDRRADLRRLSYDEEADLTTPRRRFYVSESDSDVHLDDLLRGRNTLSTSFSERNTLRARASRADRRSLYGERTSSSDSPSDDDRAGSAYSSCGSVNDIVDKFKNYNRRVRDMVVNSLAELDDAVINQGTSDSRQPLLGFHTIHGQNVCLQRNQRVARRRESFCKGLAFSNRPIAVDENVCIRLNEVASNWSGVLRFGVTNVDPESYRGGVIPKFACPDLTSKEGYWAKALPERYSVEGNIIHFYVTNEGELFYGINGVQKGIFLSGINGRAPLWVIVDIYGNSVAVEFIDPSDFKPRGGSGRPSAIQPNSSVSSRVTAPPVRPTATTPTTSSSTSNQDSYVPSSASLVYGGVDLDVLLFHRVAGRHVTLNGIRTLATRSEQEYTQGYVFTERPVRVNEKIIVEIVAVQQLYSGGLAFGVTCCDPQTLRGKDLPDDSYDLMEMPEYWVAIKDVALGPKPNTVLQFWITSSGEVRFQKDNGTPRTIIHVDNSLQLYMWFDVYGSTQIIRLMGSCPASRAPARPPAAASSVAPSTSTVRTTLPLLPATSRSSSATRRSEISSHPGEGGTGPLRIGTEAMRLSEDANRRRPAVPPRRSTAAVDDLLSFDVPSNPPAITPSVSHTQSMYSTSLLPVTTPPSSAPSTTHGAFAPPAFASLGTVSSPRPPPLAPRPPLSQPRSAPSLPPTRPPPPPQQLSVPFPTTSPHGLTFPTSVSDPGSGNSEEEETDECCICMNAKINCVIYKCGHMCMCFDCAKRTKEMNGECPVCRKPMDDVIKCFKS